MMWSLAAFYGAQALTTPPQKVSPSKGRWIVGRIVRDRDETVVCESGQKAAHYLNRLILWLLDGFDSDLPATDYAPLFEKYKEISFLLNEDFVTYVERDFKIGETTYIFRRADDNSFTPKAGSSEPPE